MLLHLPTYEWLLIIDFIHLRYHNLELQPQHKTHEEVHVISRTSLRQNSVNKSVSHMSSYKHSVTIICIPHNSKPNC